MEYVKAKALDDVLVMPRGIERWRASIDMYNRHGVMALNEPNQAFDGMKSRQNSFMCVCCRERRRDNFFPKTPTLFLGFTARAKSEAANDYTKAWICFQCLEAIAERLQEERDLDKYSILYYLCALTGVYFDCNLAQRVISEPATYKDKTPVPPEIGFTTLYFRAAAAEDETKDKTFWDSGCLNIEALCQFQNSSEGMSLGLDEIARQNRSQIMSVFHTDPFANDTLEDKTQMYNDLVTMMDDAMTEDLVRQKAAVEIVRAFKRIDKLSEAIRELQSTPEKVVENAKDLKQLVEQKKTEAALVTNFSKDHGFAEKYALSKSKGSGTLSAIVRDMSETHFDPGVINKYDIETSTAIKEISDISAQSIFKQINLSDSEYAQMVKEQAEEMIDLRAKLAAAEEELRLFKEKHLKMELMEELAEELREKGIDASDIETVMARELKKAARAKK